MNPSTMRSGPPPHPTAPHPPACTPRRPPSTSRQGRWRAPLPWRRAWWASWGVGGGGWCCVVGWGYIHHDQDARAFPQWERVRVHVGVRLDSRVAGRLVGLRGMGWGWGGEGWPAPRPWRHAWWAPSRAVEGGGQEKVGGGMEGEGGRGGSHVKGGGLATGGGWGWGGGRTWKSAREGGTAWHVHVCMHACGLGVWAGMRGIS